MLVQVSEIEVTAREWRENTAISSKWDRGRRPCGESQPHQTDSGDREILTCATCAGRHMLRGDFMRSDQDHKDEAFVSTL
jgi:hypothetical protein